jgi:hypothetical protein
VPVPVKTGGTLTRAQPPRGRRRERERANRRLNYLTEGNKDA